MAGTNQPRGRRVLAFAALCVLSLSVAIGYPLLRRSSAAGQANAGGDAGPPVADATALAEAARGPHLLFRSTQLGSQYGRVGLLQLDKPDGPPLMTALTCERIHFASGQGICLTATRRMVTSYRAELFNSQYQTGATIALAGVPSRARMAPGGGMAAFTYFVGGDSYAAAGFSTRTFLIDPAKGTTLVNLEELTVKRRGAPFKSVDFNFWGVTFARQPGRFYATLASGGTSYLVEGDAVARTATVLHDAVECPSLSPDNTRIAFKRRMPGLRVLWRIHVLDLATGIETAVAEARSVDDQVEWLDDVTIVYALPNDIVKAQRSTDVWAVPADGSGAPRILLANAESPAVVRPLGDDRAVTSAAVP